MRARQVHDEIALMSYFLHSIVKLGLTSCRNLVQCGIFSHHVLIHFFHYSIFLYHDLFFSTFFFHSRITMLQLSRYHHSSEQVPGSADITCESISLFS